MSESPKQLPTLLPYELWSKILGHLPAPDIIQCRTVSSQILSTSKERSTWIQVFWEAEHPIPDVDPRTISLPRLERMLVSASRMADVWSNPSRYELTPVLTRESPATMDPTPHDVLCPQWHTKSCWFMSPYVITLSKMNHVLECFLENETEPIFTYRMPSHSNLDVKGNIDPYKQVLYLAYISSGESHLEVISVKYNEECQSFTATEHSHDLHDIPSYKNLTICTVQYGYAILKIGSHWLGLGYPDIAGHGEYVVIDTTTGNRMGFHVYQEDNIWITQQYTPHHLIVVMESDLKRQLLFYNWSTLSSSTTTSNCTSLKDKLEDVNFSTKPRNRITIAVSENIHNCHIFARTSHSYLLIMSNLGDRNLNIQTLVLDLNPSTEGISIRNFDSNASNTITWRKSWVVGNIQGWFGPSPYSKSFFGAEVVELYHNNSGFTFFLEEEAQKTQPRNLLLVKIEGLSTPKTSLTLEMREFETPPFFASHSKSHGDDLWTMEALDVFSGRMLLSSRHEDLGRKLVVKFTLKH